MGIGSIMKSKEIVLMAFGESKADAIKGMIEGPVTSNTEGQLIEHRLFIKRTMTKILSQSFFRKR